MDLAPIEHEIEVREGAIHIGQDVFVKWYKYQRTTFIVVREYKNGVASVKRGINMPIQYLPNLKKAIDKAYEVYMASH